MLVANYPDAQVEYKLVSSKYARIEDTVENTHEHIDRQTYNEKINGRAVSPRFDSVPDVWRYRPQSMTGKPDFVIMDEIFQHWVFRINVERFMGQKFINEFEYRAWWRADLERHREAQRTGVKDETFVNQFGAMFRWDGSHTNYFGTDTCKDFIGQENLDADYPKYQFVVTGGFVGELEDDRIAYIAGEACRPLKCINISKPYTHLHPFDQPQYFDQPCVTGRTFSGGNSINGHFRRKYQWFGGQVVYPFCLPVDSAACVPADLLIVPSDNAPLSKPDVVYPVGDLRR